MISKTFAALLDDHQAVCSVYAMAQRRHLAGEIDDVRMARIRAKMREADEVLALAAFREIGRPAAA